MSFPPLPELPPFLSGRDLVVIDGAVLEDDTTAASILAPLRAVNPELDTFGRIPAAGLLAVHMDPPGPTPAVTDHSTLGPLDEAGIDPTETYVTNAVKHFKFTRLEERGKRRIHKPPTLREMGACRPWLTAELALIEPEIVVALGATAGKSLLGSSFRVTRQRGVVLPLPSGEGEVVATIHPSAVLRADERDREEAYAGFVADLRVVAGVLAR